MEPALADAITPTHTAFQFAVTITDAITKHTATLCRTGDGKMMSKLAYYNEEISKGNKPSDSFIGEAYQDDPDAIQEPQGRQKKKENIALVTWQRN